MNEKAFQDLVWLSERLSGIVALKDDIKSASDLKNRVKELDGAIDTKKKQLEKLVAECEDIEKVLDTSITTSKSIIDEAKVEAKDIMAKAKEEAKDLVSKAKDKAEGIVSKAETEVGKTTSSIAEQTTRLQELVEHVAREELKLSHLKEQVELIKARF